MIGYSMRIPQAYSPHEYGVPGLVGLTEFKTGKTENNSIK